MTANVQPPSTFWKQRYDTQHRTVHALEDRIAVLVEALRLARPYVMDVLNEETVPAIREIVHADMVKISAALTEKP